MCYTNYSAVWASAPSCVILAPAGRARTLVVLPQPATSLGTFWPPRAASGRAQQTAPPLRSTLAPLRSTLAPLSTLSRRSHTRGRPALACATHNTHSARTALTTHTALSPTLHVVAPRADRPHCAVRSARSARSRPAAQCGPARSRPAAQCGSVPQPVGAGGHVRGGRRSAARAVQP